MDIETIYPVKKLFMNSKNEMIISSVDKAGRPDLIDFATDFFYNGKVKVWCRLRDYVEGDIESNKGKFQPVMLTDVITTREKDDANYKFVCICCEDSTLEFPVESYGTVGIVIKAELNNAMIYGSAVHWAPFDKKLYGRGRYTSECTINKVMIALFTLKIVKYADRHEKTLQTAAMNVLHMRRSVFFHVY